MSCALRRQRRHLQAGPGGRRRSGRPVPRSGRGQLRDRRLLRRRGRLPAVRGGHAVRAARPARRARATATLARTCDGAGTCKPATTQSCAPYTCNGTTCRAACGSDADCVAAWSATAAPAARSGSARSARRPPNATAATASTASAARRRAAAPARRATWPGSAGACKPVPAGAMEPHGGCAPAPPCGFNGTCDGNGACRPMAAGTSCGTASCSGSTSTPVGACDGAGSCTQSPVSCSPYLCGDRARARRRARRRADCLAGYTCQGYSCTNLKPNGSDLHAARRVHQRPLHRGLSAAGWRACASCNSCAVAGKQGTCSPIADGTVCGAALCDGQDRLSLQATCTAGQCVTPTARTIDCTPYACDAPANACKPSCATDADCAKKNMCTLSGAGPGTCGP